MRPSTPARRSNRQAPAARDPPIRSSTGSRTPPNGAKEKAGNSHGGAATTKAEETEIEPQRINRIVIHEADTLDDPAAGIENAFLQVRDMKDESHPWKTVATVHSGWAYVPGRQAFQMKPVTKFLFNTVKTDQVRIVINTVKEKKRGESRQTDERRPERSIVMTVRLMEIEVTGSEADMSNGASRVEASSRGKKRSAMKEPM